MLDILRVQVLGYECICLSMLIWLLTTNNLETRGLYLVTYFTTNID